MSGMKVFENTAILGVGLIGASLALSMRSSGLTRKITGYGRTEANLKRAQELGIIDAYCLDAASAVSGADFVVICTPVGLFSEIAAEIRPSLAKGTLVTDVGSVKGALVAELEKAMPDGVNFIGSHPIAGGDKSGIDEARRDLFSGARCIVTPTAHSDKASLEIVKDIWAAAGGRVEVMDAFLHDEIFGLVSHLPHVIAYALVNTVDSIDPERVEYSGGGFKDTTRIAMSSPEMWRDICRANSANMLKSLEVFRDNLDRMEQCIASGDWQWLEKEFARAQKLRTRIRQQ